MKSGCPGVKKYVIREIFADGYERKAIVEVSQVIDDCSVYAFSSVSKDKILIEFEDSVGYMEGDRIFIEGSLEINETEH